MRRQRRWWISALSLNDAVLTRNFVGVDLLSKLRIDNGPTFEAALTSRLRVAVAGVEVDVR